jgi:hypothetical protein
MARPRIISEGPTEQTTFRVGYEELEQARALCRELNISLGQFLREAMNEKVERVNDE